MDTNFNLFPIFKLSQRTAYFSKLEIASPLQNRSPLYYLLQKRKTSLFPYSISSEKKQLPNTRYKYPIQSIFSKTVLQNRLHYLFRLLPRFPKTFENNLFFKIRNNITVTKSHYVTLPSIETSPFSLFRYRHKRNVECIFRNQEISHYKIALHYITIDGNFAFLPTSISLRKKQLTKSLTLLISPSPYP